MSLLFQLPVSVHLLSMFVQYHWHTAVCFLQLQLHSICCALQFYWQKPDHHIQLVKEFVVVTVFICSAVSVLISFSCHRTPFSNDLNPSLFFCRVFRSRIILFFFCLRIRVQILNNRDAIIISKNILSISAAVISSTGVFVTITPPYADTGSHAKCIFPGFRWIIP